MYDLLSALEENHVVVKCSVGDGIARAVKGRQQDKASRQRMTPMAAGARWLRATEIAKGQRSSAATSL